MPLTQGSPEERARACYADGAKNAAGLKPFYSTPNGHPTVVTEADLAQTIHEADGSKYEDLVEIDRYWAVFPYSYISICRSKNHGELRYFVVEPYLSKAEEDNLSNIIEKIQSRIRNYDTVILSSDANHRRAIIREAAIELFEYYNMLSGKTVREAHNNTEYSTEDFEIDPESVVEKYIQRFLLGKEEENSRSHTVCRRHAISCGATASYDYLPLTETLEGHPDAQSVEHAKKCIKANGSDGQEGVADSDGDEDNEERGIAQRLISPIQARLGSQNKGETESADQDEVDSPEARENSFTTDTSINGAEDTKKRTDGGSQIKSGSPGQLPAQETDVLSTAENSQTDIDKPNRLGTLPPAEERFKVQNAAIQSDGDPGPLTEYQIYKLLYYIEREFIGYKKIDAIKNDDKNVEDISGTGYNKPVYVYHKNYGQIQTNVVHGTGELDNFVTALAQFAGEELSRRQPSTDAKLPDGSRASLTLGYEISESGSEYTIRQFKEIPHTPVDLINWETYGINQMALLWLFVEYDRSLMIVGKTGAGKTTTLNALSLFIPSNNKIVSIEDTQELQLPHENWIVSTTREVGDLTDDAAKIDEFELLKDALRKRPDRILLGEIRGQEADELFQSIRTGHPGLTTFHASSFESMVNRMTSEPIHVPKQVLVALDVVLVQGDIRVEGNKIRRNRSISEVVGLQETEDGQKVEENTISEYDAQTDHHKLITDNSIQLNEVAELNGWSEKRQQREILIRRVVLAALIVEEINTYNNVSAIIQAAILDPDQVLDIIANDSLSDKLDHLTEDLLNVSIDEEASEENVERPTPSEEVRQEAETILEVSKQKGVLSEYV